MILLKTLQERLDDANWCQMPDVRKEIKKHIPENWPLPTGPWLQKGAIIPRLYLMKL
jgi:hypothetical protein